MELQSTILSALSTLALLISRLLKTVRLSLSANLTTGGVLVHGHHAMLHVVSAARLVPSNVAQYLIVQLLMTLTAPTMITSFPTTRRAAMYETVLLGSMARGVHVSMECALELFSAWALTMAPLIATMIACRVVRALLHHRPRLASKSAIMCTGVVDDIHGWVVWDNHIAMLWWHRWVALGKRVLQHRLHS